MEDEEEEKEEEEESSSLLGPAAFPFILFLFSPFSLAGACVAEKERESECESSREGGKRRKKGKAGG